MSIVCISSAWSKDDASTMEAILGEVTDVGVPRISEALLLLARALNSATEGAVSLDPCDPVFTDAMRCLLCHPWLVPSVQRKDKSGKTVASFFTQPFGAGQGLSLFSSQESFAKLQRAAAKVGSKLSPVPLTFGQIMMGHLPNMSLEAMRKNNVPESNAVLAISLDPMALLEAAPDSKPVEENLVVFAETTFPMLQSFCYCYLLAGNVLQVQEALEDGPAAVPADHWSEVLCSQSLNAIVTGESESVFASEAGMLLFCYPGDAAKVLSHHRRKGMAELEDGKIVSMDPLKVLHLMAWQAKENRSTLILATAMESDGELQLHGLSITPQLFTETVEPAFAKQSK
eukprot:gb/GFBE01031714.1/.p1 GENE.gb/GFBE01031714.1/~~gb/GFBE01031714.1/.p1  ORF type:complete len:343 (+),score=83.67 gb/GFBE01031714.1/:1-1029(+)